MSVNLGRLRQIAVLPGGVSPARARYPSSPSELISARVKRRRTVRLRLSQRRSEAPQKLDSRGANASVGCASREPLALEHPAAGCRPRRRDGRCQNRTGNIGARVADITEDCDSFVLIQGMGVLRIPRDEAVRVAMKGGSRSDLLPAGYHFCGPRSNPLAYVLIW
jgi:hypothetical protein